MASPDIFQSRLSVWLTGSLLLSLRIAPLLAFAPPFTLVRLPARYRLLFSFGLSASLAAVPGLGLTRELAPEALLTAGARELVLGLLFVILFQISFAALSFAGRVVDIQAGFGLAAVIDPTTRAQTPLIGTLFAYAAAALFFATDGHLELLRILAASLKAVPLGTWTMPGSIDPLLGFIAGAFIVALGVAGAAIGVLFAIDLTIAFMARTAPQMNALVLGIQIKTIALLLILPLSFGIGGALLLRMARLALDALPGLVG